jgi:hypothetical protein
MWGKLEIIAAAPILKVQQLLKGLLFGGVFWLAA